LHTKHEFLPPDQFLRFSQRTCPIHYFRSKTNVWGSFAQFRCRTSPIPKTGVGVHRKHEFLPLDQFLSFSKRTCPIHYFRSKTHVWGGFAQFRCRTSPIPKTGVGVHTKHEFLPLEPFLRFSQRTCPIQYFRSKTHVWGGFVQFHCRTSPIRKRVSGCIQSTSFCHRNHFFVFHNEHVQSTNLGPKLMFGVVSRNFVAARHPFRKRVSGCIRSMSFCHRNHFFVFSQRTCPIHYFRSKTHVWSGFVQFRCRTSTIRKWVSGCIQARVFATGTVSSLFAMNLPNPLI
jgi:RNA polymerase subunit RPABC4/transcription elongation factor Spt4